MLLIMNSKIYGRFVVGRRHCGATIEDFAFAPVFCIVTNLESYVITHSLPCPHAPRDAKWAAVAK